jgi:hypothetical protein
MTNVMHKFFSMCLFLFITLYMFRAHRVHHQERQIVSIQPLVTVILCWWPRRVQFGRSLLPNSCAIDDWEVDIKNKPRRLVALHTIVYCFIVALHTIVYCFIVALHTVVYCFIVALHTVVYCFIIALHTIVYCFIVSLHTVVYCFIRSQKSKSWYILFKQIF